MFEDRTTEQIKREILDEIAPELGISTQAGSFADAVAGPVAQALSGLYKTLPAVVSMLFLDPGSGPFIDRVARDYYGLERREGTKARCAVTFSGEPGTAVPAGTVFLTASGLRFVLLAEAVLSLSGSAIGTLEAAEPGAAYNVPAGAVDRLAVNLAGLEGFETTPGTGGSDGESDEALYLRVADARKRPATSGNGWDYRRWALAVEGVGAAKVVELWNGPGTVGLTLADSSFRAPSPEIVAAAVGHIRENRPIGAEVTVAAAREVPVSVSARIIPLGTTAGAVGEALKARLEEQFQRLIQQKYQTIYYSPEEDQSYTLLYNRVLTLLLSIDGVDTFTALSVNGGTEDITIPADSIPVLEEVTVV